MNYLHFVFTKHLRELREYIYNIHFLNLRGGFNQPDSHFIKRKRILEIQNNFSYDVFFESGTFYGSMISAVNKLFKHNYSVEIFKPLAMHNIRYFRPFKNISILFGDSSRCISDVIKMESEKTFLFWLDGHYSGNGTGIGKEVSPILIELDSIFRSELKAFSIIIDDWRLFDGIDYPSKVEVLCLVNSFSTLHLTILEDGDALVISK
jgi:hypothetical protein